MQNDVYFANLPESEIGPVLYDRVNNYFDEIERNGRLAMWRKVHRFYFALDEQGFHEASGIQRGGEQNELSLLKANHFRNLLQHLHVLTTQQRPAFECRAINTDHKSQIQTILGRNILEYYLREKRLEQIYRQAAEVAINYAEAYVEIEWDETLGDDVRPDMDEETGELIPGSLMKTGDVVARVYEPINVIRRCKADSRGKQDWYILRRWESRFDLAAKHRDNAEAILQHSDQTQDSRLYYYGTGSEQEDEDLIPVYILYHDRTAACPEGRRVKFLGPDLVLEYADLGYADLPVFPMIPSHQHGTSFGYSVSFDLLCVQEAIDLLYSTVLSNQAAFGVQNIWMKPGSNLNPSQLGGGLNILESDVKPEPINLTNTPPEIFNFLKGIETLGEVLSGINSVARGQPEASLKSGSALALVASQAVQFSNGLAAAYAHLLEDTGTAILRTLQTRATLPRAAMIAGKDNKSYIKDFSGEDLKSINRVVVEVANPLSQTLAGRMQMAQDLMQGQQFTDPDQYIQVITTGRLEHLTESKRTEQLLIDAENEALREGRPVQALDVDMHLLHIQGHKVVLGDPDARLDPSIVGPTLAHIQSHIEALRSVDPALLNALGQAPIQIMPDGSVPPPQGQNAPQPNALPPDQGQPVPAPQGSSEAIQNNMPQMPAPAGAA